MMQLHYPTLKTLLGFLSFVGLLVHVMETDNRKNQRLEVFGILKEAVTIPCKSIYFLTFTIIISFPLLSFMIYYETFLFKTMVETWDLLSTRDYSDYIWPLPYPLIPENMNQDLAYKLIQLGLLYLVPLHLLDLFTMVLTIALASKVYSSEDRPLIDKPIYMAKLRGTFITSLYVLFWSTCTLLGLIWLVINSIFLTNFIYIVLFSVIYGAAFVALLMKYLEWSAQWNMAVVISILKEVKGVDALVLSGYLCRGTEKLGRILMLVFFAWGVCLRLPCLVFGYHEIGIGMVLQNVFYSLGNVIKWMACMVYFYDCKKRVLEKKVEGAVWNVECG
ncbi:uncharacterized protein LOC123214742 isoform X1 [Mangifera indica]|uniref:uncharacterized protein LOC123214742 isoform X1 n=1 Tax=Mangifera indica TaxID=29780 RepID=UPI001CF9CE18|nr:uncharacterized protein LOC123214742 isoform X1 [Mangifera indica]XP_044490642.1 uncharacterized protein LOC123214742 isoform X1 [Mangifera indica]XP_044490643.1 uncharacterized protein LOC123214742 isoform X1 [Mangifera indica]